MLTPTRHRFLYDDPAVLGPRLVVFAGAVEDEGEDFLLHEFEILQALNSPLPSFFTVLSAIAPLARLRHFFDIVEGVNDVTATFDVQPGLLRDARGAVPDGATATESVIIRRLGDIQRPAAEVDLE